MTLEQFLDTYHLSLDAQQRAAAGEVLQQLRQRRQRLHRRADLPDIQPVPPQRQCRAHKAEYRTLPLRRGQKQRKYACADTRKPHRQQPVHCQQILRGKYSGGKAAAKNSQSSHFTNFCSVRPAYRTRAAPVLLSQPHVTHGPLPLLHFNH